MNWLDIVLILIFAVFAFLGFKRGLIRAVLILVGLILGVFLAGRFYLAFSGWLPIANVTAARVLAFILIFVAVVAVACVVAFLLRKTISAIMLGWADRLLGAVFGLVAGAVICGALLALFAHFLDIEGTVSQSWIASILLDRVPLLLALLPEEFDAVRGFFQ